MVGSWEEDFKIPIAELKPQQEDATFVCIQRPVSSSFLPTRPTSMLHVRSGVEWSGIVLPRHPLGAFLPYLCRIVCVLQENTYSSGSLACTLNFVVKEWDAAAEEELEEEGMEDEYALEDLEVVEADFMKPPASLSLLEFRSQW